MDAAPGAGPRRARGGRGAPPPEPGPAAAPPPWARFSAWLECVCVVTFDLELGQALELVYPTDFRLTDKEKSSICYLSFPDSHSGGLGDTQFSFRIRQSGGQREPWHAEDRLYNQAAPEALQREAAHYFGYVYFRQVKDSSVKRGYFQKSLVLVSRLPFVRLFQALLTLIAPEYFDKLAPCLEAGEEPAGVGCPGPADACPHGSHLLPPQVRVPSRADIPESSPPKPCGREKLLPAPVVLASVHELDLFRCFQPVLMHVQMLWELVLLGEPLVVLAPSPAVSSEMVLALTSLLRPLRFCSDYRPYFTVHDSEFKELTTRTRAPCSSTGPTSSGWASPECQVRGGSGLHPSSPARRAGAGAWVLQPDLPGVFPGGLPKQVKLKKPSRLKTLDTKPGLCPAPPGGHPPQPAPARLSPQTPVGVCSRAQRSQRDVLPGPGGYSTLDTPRPGEGLLDWGCPSRPHAVPRLPPGLYTSYAAHLHRDKALLKRLLKGVQKQRPSDVQSAVLRRHLLELTQSFIIPLEHYLASLMPLRKSIVAWKTPPQIRPFRQDDFLRSLEHAGPQLTCFLKGDWLGLYRRFFKSPHFDGWYRQRHQEMAQKLEAVHLEAICEADIEAWMKDKSEVEVVDLVLKLREKLVRAQGHRLPVKAETLQRAQLYIEMAIGALPKDLQAVLCPP
ncbi:protein DENND6B isoform X2 [Dasypus novemcinctus]|uniref:protein DENND6B isoform X2 n=1 Tax=Dasypus novemcinctus TaxID=9361 RepID=UPI0026601622|nr:protein DENND6B isoform X2 [Dasypus novemcinctus]